MKSALCLGDLPWANRCRLLLMMMMLDYYDIDNDSNLCKFYTDTFDKLVLKVCRPLYVANADPPSGTCSSEQTYCYFKCQIGYQLKGSELRLCQPGGIWSGTPTTCVVIEGVNQLNHSLLFFKVQPTMLSIGTHQP